MHAKTMVVGARKLPTLLAKRARCSHYKIKSIYTFGMLPFQQINYPILYGVGIPARPVYRTGTKPVLQEKVRYFLIRKSLIIYRYFIIFREQV